MPHTVQAGLFTLPAELREHIYDICYSVTPFTRNLLSAPSYPAWGLATANKQAYHETHTRMQLSYDAWVECQWIVDLDIYLSKRDGERILAKDLYDMATSMSAHDARHVPYLQFHTTAFDRQGPYAPYGLLLTMDRGHSYCSISDYSDDTHFGSAVWAFEHAVDGCPFFRSHDMVLDAESGGKTGAHARQWTVRGIAAVVKVVYNMAREHAPGR